MLNIMLTMLILSLLTIGCLQKTPPVFHLIKGATKIQVRSSSLRAKDGKVIDNSDIKKTVDDSIMVSKFIEFANAKLNDPTDWEMDDNFKQINRPKIYLTLIADTKLLDHFGFTESIFAAYDKDHFYAAKKISHDDFKRILEILKISEKEYQEWAYPKSN